MVNLISSVVISTLSIFSTIITILKELKTIGGGNLKKTVFWGVLFLISVVIAILSIPKASSGIKEYSNYKQEVEIQRDEYRQKYELAKEYADEGNMVEAIKQLQMISENYDLYDEVEELLSSCEKNYKNSILKEAEQLEKEGRLEEAINVIKSAMIILTEDADLDLKLEKYNNDLNLNVVNNALEKSTDYTKKGNYPEAILTLKGAIDKYPDNQQLELKLMEYEKVYTEEILERVAELRTEYDIDSAINILNEALTILPKNNELLSQMDECKNIKVDLSSLTYLNESGNITDVDVIETNTGELVKNGFWMKGYTPSRTYAIDGKYSMLEGIFALTDEGKNNTARCILTIEIDGKEYTSLEMKAGVRPIEFEVPLTNIQDITFSIYAEGYQSVVIGNTVLYKN